MDTFDMGETSILVNNLLDEKEKLKKSIDDEKYYSSIKSKNIEEYNNILDTLKSILQSYIMTRLSQIKIKVPNETEESRELIKDFKETFQIYIDNINKQYISTCTGDV